MHQPCPPDTLRPVRARPFLATLAVGSSLACATPPPPAPPVAPVTAKPELHCRTAVEIHPGTGGAAASATPVEYCEPAAPPAAAEALRPAADDEAPLGTPETP